MAEMRSRRNGARRAERPVAGTGAAGWGGKGMETSSAEAARRRGGAGDAVPERNGWHGGVEWCTLVPLVSFIPLVDTVVPSDALVERGQRGPAVARREGGVALRRTPSAPTRTWLCAAARSTRMRRGV
ncbi:hypothetical protein FGB62_113g121 [Gracilaria domingensis]|nr:hypothetical protein FGB62_113g121 [Gracilaria domingensis]